MSLEACRTLVERGDPDRFLAAGLAPPEAQKVLWPLYAMNVEVSRAPWVTQEPMIAEMRLQWWREVLGEIAEGKPVRNHEVTIALAEAIGTDEAARLDTYVEARRWDIYRDAFEDEDALLAYLDRTTGQLMVAGASALGAGPDSFDAIAAFGRGVGLSRFLQAVPDLEARGRIPLVDGRPDAIRALCVKVLVEMPPPKALARKLGPLAGSVLREGWQARAILKQVIATPARVAKNAVGLSEFSKRWLLLLS